MTTTEYFAYIMLGKNTLYIKNMNDKETIRRVMTIRNGDKLSIKGLPDMEVIHVYFDTDKFDETKYSEIGLHCRTVSV